MESVFSYLDLYFTLILKITILKFSARVASIYNILKGYFINCLLFKTLRMIDLLKNYKQLQNAPGYVGSLRYFLAKKKLDTLFVKWLSSNKQTVQQLLKKAQKGALKASQQPNPLFSHHRVPLKNSMSMSISQMNFNNTITPPKMPQQFGQSKKKNLNETSLNLAQSAFISKPISKQTTSQIPQFYFPKGKPVDNVTKTTTRSQINAIVGQKVEVTEEMIKKLTCDVLGLPNYFSTLLTIRATGKADSRVMKKAQFQELWKQLQNKDIQYRAFYLISSDKKKKYCLIDDFKILFKQILQIHPGLQFLKDSPDFQDWFSLCVIHRMFYMANRKGDYKVTFRQFKKSNILKSFFDIQGQPDINRNTDFFSYEDFYVIYIKFWQLDSDHDFFLQKQELSKYSGYTLSRKTVQRIFCQTAKTFKQPNKMTFGDFVWFILSVEDKTTEQSIQYWFRIMDLDGNGIVTGYELEYFYQEQNQRLAYMDSTLDFNFENIICQMVDLLRPKNHIQFTLDDFLAKRQQASVFINMLTDLNKLVGFQQRDAYEERNIKQQNPLWTEWDRFVKPEYKRIQSTTEDENNEVLNWENDD